LFNDVGFCVIGVGLYFVAKNINELKKQVNKLLPREVSNWFSKNGNIKKYRMISEEKSDFIHSGFIKYDKKTKRISVVRVRRDQPLNKQKILE